MGGFWIKLISQHHFHDKHDYGRIMPEKLQTPSHSVIFLWIHINIVLILESLLSFVYAKQFLRRSFFLEVLCFSECDHKSFMTLARICSVQHTQPCTHPEIVLKGQWNSVLLCHYARCLRALSRPIINPVKRCLQSYMCWKFMWHLQESCLKKVLDHKLYSSNTVTTLQRYAVSFTFSVYPSNKLRSGDARISTNSLKDTSFTYVWRTKHTIDTNHYHHKSSLIIQYFRLVKTLHLNSTDAFFQVKSGIFWSENRERKHSI